MGQTREGVPPPLPYPSRGPSVLCLVIGPFPPPRDLWASIKTGSDLQVFHQIMSSHQASKQEEVNIKSPSGINVPLLPPEHHIDEEDGMYRYAKAMLAELRAQRPYFITLQLQEILHNAQCFLTREFIEQLFREGDISRFEFLMLTREPPRVNIPSSPTARKKLNEKRMERGMQSNNLIKEWMVRSKTSGSKMHRCWDDQFMLKRVLHDMVKSRKDPPQPYDLYTIPDYNDIDLSMYETHPFGYPEVF